MDILGQCPWCHKEAESDVHVLFVCDFAKTVWMNTELYDVLKVWSFDTAFMIILRAFESCNRQKRVQIAML